jgi:outer membrane protein assembly factor BamB
VWREENLMKFCAFVFCVAVCWMPAAAAPVSGPRGQVAWLECSFGPVPGRERVPLLLMTVGNRVERAVVPPLGMAPVNVDGLKVGDARVTGRMVIGHEPLRQNRSVPRRASRMPVTVDISIRGERLEGSFSGSWPKANTFDQPVPVQGKITGVRRDEARLRAENGLAAGAAWPGYVGPHQNFSSGPCAAPLVEDLNQARLVWASQWIGPPESGSKRYGACVGARPSAGGASPLVWNGRVYQFRYQASGDVYHEHLDKQLSGEKAAEVREKMEAVGWTEADMRRRWAISADEELVCIDAATGNTLWTVTWPGEGVNLYDHKCSLTNHTGVVAGGRVYVFGALGRLRCVDAASGQVLWRAEVPGYSDFMKKFKARAFERRDVSSPTRSFLHGLAASGGTVIAPDGIGACGLVGFDGTTGAALWRVSRCLGKAATPLAWSANGRHYVLAADAGGAITCIHARTGTVAWRCDDAGYNEYSVVLAGDILVGHALTAGEREKIKTPDDDKWGNHGQIAAWRLSTAGAVRVWTAPVAWGAPSHTPSAAALGELVCFRGKRSYHILRAASGERIATSHLPVEVRWDEGHMLALPGMFVPHPDTQHGHNKFFTYPARAGAQVGPMWSPPHPHATTYQVAMSHAWADGRLFIRGGDALYCYDLRARRR